MKPPFVHTLQRLVPLLLIATVLAFVAVGCNTAHGFGKDVQKTGEKIQDKTQ